MTSLELLQEIDAWLSFNNSPSKEQISELRNDIKKHIRFSINPRFNGVYTLLYTVWRLNSTKLYLKNRTKNIYKNERRKIR